jgi:hypothetical protein
MTQIQHNTHACKLQTTQSFLRRTSVVNSKGWRNSLLFASAWARLKSIGGAVWDRNRLCRSTTVGTAIARLTYQYGRNSLTMNIRTFFSWDRPGPFRPGSFRYRNSRKVNIQIGSLLAESASRWIADYSSRKDKGVCVWSDLVGTWHEGAETCAQSTCVTENLRGTSRAICRDLSHGRGHSVRNYHG